MCNKYRNTCLHVFDINKHRFLIFFMYLIDNKYNYLARIRGNNDIPDSSRVRNENVLSL